MERNILSTSLILFIICKSGYGSKLTKHFPADPQEVHLVSAMVGFKHSQIVPFGIYGEGEEEQREAFEQVVADINRDANLLKKTLLKADTIHNVNQKNAYTLKEKLCAKMAENTGITAIFGANSEAGVSVVRSLADAFKIPYLFAVNEIPVYEDSVAINIYPKSDALTMGIEKIVHDMDWISFTLLYEKDEDLILFQDLLIEHNNLKDEENFSPINLRKLPVDEDYGPILKEIQNATETRILLHCAKENVIPILRKAENLHLMGDYYAYVIVSLEAHSIDFSEFTKTNTNITTLSIIDPRVYNFVQRDTEQKKGSPFVNENINKLTLSSLLTYDSVYVFASGLSSFLENEELNEVSLNCSGEVIFEDGLSLINYIKAAPSSYLTGLIRLNEVGERDFFMLQIIQVSPKAHNRLGTWDPDHSNEIIYTRNNTQLLQEAEDFIANKTFIVSSILGPPYLMKCSEEENAEKFEEEPCYEGFTKDLLDLIARDQKFRYKITLAPDGKQGSVDPITGKWNGIIKEVQERRADLGICDLTITSDRRKVVDFTKPFMSLGISILYRRGVEEEAHMFSFLSPLKFEVWLCVATSYLGISIILFIVSRFSPYSWESSHPCDPNTTELENQLSLVNCLWFSLGSVLQQGCDILPTATSSRIVAGMWWFFTLIMGSTYTANLAAFLTSQQMESEIKDVNALASQNVVKYGCKPDGSTGAFFRNSNDNLYQKIWASMESTKPSVFAKDNNEGKNRVLREKNYAFFMESSTIEYLVERHCELTQVGGLLDNKGYGIAMPLNSPYRTPITTSLLRQQENGNIKELKNKWWINHDESKKCPKANKDAEEENALDVSNVGGVFVVLGIGIFFAFILSVLEFLWNIRKVAVIEKISISRAFWKELRFILNCHISTKPVRKPSEKSSELSQPIDRYQALLALKNSQ